MIADNTLVLLLHIHNNYNQLKLFLSGFIRILLANRLEWCYNSMLKEVKLQKTSLCFFLFLLIMLCAYLHKLLKQEQLPNNVGKILSIIEPPSI